MEARAFISRKRSKLSEIGQHKPIKNTLNCAPQRCPKKNVDVPAFEGILLACRQR